MSHIHWLTPYNPSQYHSLRDLLHPSLHLSMGDELPPLATPIEVLISGVPQCEQLAALPQLHTLIIPWAGLPASTRTLLADFPHLRVHNLHHNATAVAEMTLSLLLAAANKLIPCDRALRQHDWTPRYREEENRAVGLAGKTALILGYGAIGQLVAERCRAFGMRVLATRRTLASPTADPWAEIHPQTALPELLPHSHALIVCLPLTPETRGLIGTAELQALAQPSLVVNIGRGAVIQEQALYEALASGRLHGAGLDVWYNYPKVGEYVAERHEAIPATPPSHYPFHELDNVVLSPHRASNSDTAEHGRLTHLADLLNHLPTGHPLPNAVDWQRGY